MMQCSIAVHFAMINKQKKMFPLSRQNNLYYLNCCYYVLTLHSDIDDLVDVKRELISMGKAVSQVDAPFS